MSATVRRIHMTHSSHYPGAADLAPGWILITELGTVKGAKTETVSEKQGNEYRIKKKIKYDNPELQKTAQSYVNEALHLLRMHATALFSGLYFCSDQSFKALDEALDPLREQAADLNEVAAQIGSKRETKIEVFPVPMDRDNPRLALRIGRIIYERLKELRESFESDDYNDFLMAFRMCKNMGELVVGEQANVVKAAIHSADDQRTILTAHQGGRRGVARLMKETGGKLPALNFKEIDRAIDMFAPAFPGR